MVYGSPNTLNEKIAKMQRLVSEGLESGVSKSTPDEILKKAKALALKQRKLF